MRDQHPEGTCSPPPLTSALLSCLMVSLCTTCGSPTLQRNGEGDLSLSQADQRLIQLPTDVRWARLTEAGGVVYAEGVPRSSGGAAAGELVAVDVATQRILWQRDYGRLESDLSTVCGWPFAQADRLILLCDDAVVGLRQSDGEPVWTTPVRGPNLIDADGERLMVLSDPNIITALDPDSGAVIDRWIFDGYDLVDGFRGPVANRYLLRADVVEQRDRAWLIADLEDGGELALEEGVRFSPPNEHDLTPEMPCWDYRPTDDWTINTSGSHDAIIYPNRFRRRVALPWLLFGASNDPDWVWPLRLVVATVDSPERQEWEVTLVDSRGACAAGAQFADVYYGDSTVLVTKRLGRWDAPIQQLQARLLDLRSGQLISKETPGDEPANSLDSAPLRVLGSRRSCARAKPPSGALVLTTPEELEGYD